MKSPREFAEREVVRGELVRSSSFEAGAGSPPHVHMIVRKGSAIV